MEKRTLLQGAGCGLKCEKKNSLDQHFNPIRMNGVRTSHNSESTGSRRFGRAWSDGPDAGGPRRFTNTAVPRFDGTGCWQQHILIFRAIMKSNGWSMTTAALQFENAYRRPRVDPATFAMELGILAVRGFADMNRKAWDLMIRNKFIVVQRSCELRRHLDGAAEEASMGTLWIVAEFGKVIQRPNSWGVLDGIRMVVS